jgi:hypothetical protein
VFRFSITDPQWGNPRRFESCGSHILTFLQFFSHVLAIYLWQEPCFALLLVSGIYLALPSCVMMLRLSSRSSWPHMFGRRSCKLVTKPPEVLRIVPKDLTKSRQTTGNTALYDRHKEITRSRKTRE